MEPGLARFESEQAKVKYVHVNIDERKKPENKKLFDSYFKGEAIPYTVLLGEDKSVKAAWTGAKTYKELVSEISKLEQGDGKSK